MTKTGFVLVCFAALGACGGSGTSAPETKSVMITAATGGTVSVGSASLDIPAGSLGADTMVTVTSESAPAGTPDAGTIQGSYYAFGPSGTAFNPPATLSLPGAAAPAGKMAVISTIADGGSTWTDLATTFADGKLTASVAHFSGFAVRYVVVGGASVDCSKAKPACGGDVTGSWTFSAVCVTDPSSLTKPVSTDCPTGTVTKTEKIQGSAMFNTDMTYSVDYSIEIDGAAVVPASCIAASGMNFASCSAVIDALANKSVGATCTGTPASGCNCTASNVDPPQMTMEMGTYTKGVNSFSTTKTGATTPDSPTSYCVDGTTMWVQIDNPAGYLVLTKK